MNDKNIKKANLTKRWMMAFSIIALTVVLAFSVFIVVTVISYDEKPVIDDNSQIINSSSQQDSVSSDTESSKPSMPLTVTYGDVTLDADYSNLLLVNGSNPLPEDYDYEGNLITVEDKYINGSLKQVDKDVWPYMKAMIEAAWQDEVKLYIWSPYRSYDTQKILFENKIKRVIDAKGLDRASAEIEAATVVARPGTSEHHTGLATDFNMANSGFENTEMYKWMKENASKYGFVMRYSADKQSITGVIHESWHWRFVGINAAKEMNDLGLCLEEYVEYIKNQKTEG